jgi:toxin ParE1/3/4
LKTRRVQFSPEAKQDQFQLCDWIASASSAVVAARNADRLEKECLALNLASERGHRRDDVRPGLRIVGFERRVTIAFEVSSDTVTILRLFYGGRNWEEQFES